MPQTFPLLSRLLHWTMAVLILAMLFVGVAMVSSLADYSRLVAIRSINRLLSPPPPLPAAMPPLLKVVAHASHWLLYGLMFALPLVGWGMLSAGGYPIPLIGSFHLPPILPHDKALYAILRPAHTVLAYLLFLTFLAHLGAALTHALVFKDGVFRSMVVKR